MARNELRFRTSLHELVLLKFVSDPDNVKTNIPIPVSFSRRAVALIDINGQLVHISRRLRALCQLADGLSLAETGLSFAKSDDLDLFGKLLHNAKNSDRNGVDCKKFMIVQRPSGRRGFVVRVSLGCIDEVTAVGIDPIIVVSVSDPDDPLEIDNLIVSELFCLTPKESRLVSQIASGLSLANAAKINGVTIGSARQQLKSVFRKMKVNTQAELVRLAITAAAQCLMITIVLTH